MNNIFRKVLKMFKTIITWFKNLFTIPDPILKYPEKEKSTWYWQDPNVEADSIQKEKLKVVEELTQKENEEIINAFDHYRHNPNWKQMRDVAVLRLKAVEIVSKLNFVKPIKNSEDMFNRADELVDWAVFSNPPVIFPKNKCRKMIAEDIEIIPKMTDKDIFE